MKNITLIIALITFFSVYAFADVQQNDNKEFTMEFQTDTNTLKNEFWTPKAKAIKQPVYKAKPKKVYHVHKKQESYQSSTHKRPLSIVHHKPFVDNYRFLQVVTSNEDVKEYNKTNILLNRYVCTKPMKIDAVEEMALLYKANKVLTLKHNSRYYFYFFAIN